MNRLGQSQRTDLSTSLRVDPRVVLSSQILQLSQPELEQAIETELNENPALERLHEEQEPIAEETILRVVAPHELKPSSEDAEFRRSLPADESLPDWIDLAPSESSLYDHLRAQLLTTLPSELKVLGEYMIECVNEKGYLGCELEEIALATNYSLEDTELVLKHLQSCEPVGVGARNLQECLLLQLRGASTFERKLARTIVKHCIDDFIGRRVKKISHRFKVLPDVVESAFGEITSLSPFPGEGFSASGKWNLGNRSVGVTPDIAIERTELGWHIEVRGAEPSNLKINSMYERRLRELGRKAEVCKDEKRHISTYVQRAQDFIKSIEQRRETMRRIGQYLVDHQAGFVSTGGYQFLQALTRSQMAKDLGLHESTVSRATMNKFVQIANGEIVPFDVFFKPALRVQKMIEEILATENPGNPLSDEQIAQLLAKKGVIVARRTVNKYRDRTKLLSSRKRRSA